MLISSALAGHGVVSTGSSGGGNALLIILAVFIVLGLVYVGHTKWRKRMLGRDGNDESQGR